MAFRMSTGLKNALCLEVLTLMAGTSGTAGTASLTIMAGTQAASADDAGTGGTLCVITGIGWNTATSGTSALAGMAYTGTAGTSGTAVWARLECINDSGTCRIDGDVGTAAGNVFTINVNSFSSGGLITLTAADIYMA